MDKEWLKSFEGLTIKEIKATGFLVEITFKETNHVLFVEGEHEHVGININTHLNK